MRGRGHYVGTVFSVIQAAPGWFGEGDDAFFVDGEKQAGIQGTGTEDYFNDAWSLRVSEGPYWGVPVAEGTGQGARMTAYRWHLRDPIPFRESLRFVFEHAGWTYNPDGSVRSAFEERPDLFSSVAFWYQDGIASGLPEPPYGSARLPHGNARQIEVESLIDQIRTENAKAEVQKEVFWSRDLLFLRANGPGARVDIPVEIAADGFYELVAQVAHAPDYGDYRTLLDGQPLEAGDLEHEPGANTGGGTLVRAWGSELYVAEDHLLGWRRLSKGRHVVSFVCAGKDARSDGYHLGIDTIVVAKVASPEKTEAPRVPSTLTEMTDMLRSPDPIARGVAALALRDLGSARARGSPGPGASLEGSRSGRAHDRRRRHRAARARRGRGPGRTHRSRQSARRARTRAAKPRHRLGKHRARRTAGAPRAGGTRKDSQGRPGRHHSHAANPGTLNSGALCAESCRTACRPSSLREIGFCAATPGTRSCCGASTVRAWNTPSPPPVAFCRRPSSRRRSCRRSF